MQKTSLFTILLLLPLIFVGIEPALANHSYFYYADLENPPITERHPPYSVSRKKIGGSFGYVSIRYPSQKPSGGKEDLPFTMMVSVGNGLLKEASINFQFNKLALYRDKTTPIELVPSFYNEILKKRETGMKALFEYRHEAPSHLHRRVDIICTGCKAEYKKVVLEVEVVIDYLNETKTIREVIPLYLGQYVTQS